MRNQNICVCISKLIPLGVDRLGVSTSAIFALQGRQPQLDLRQFRREWCSAVPILFSPKHSLIAREHNLQYLCLGSVSSWTGGAVVAISLLLLKREGNKGRNTSVTSWCKCKCQDFVPAYGEGDFRWAIESQATCHSSLVISALSALLYPIHLCLQSPTLRDQKFVAIYSVCRKWLPNLWDMVDVGEPWEILGSLKWCCVCSGN